MQEFLISLFGDFGRIIIFLHVISGSFLIGSMFMIRFIIKPVLTNISDEAVRYGGCIKILERYFYYLLVIMLIIAIASFTMSIGLGFKYASPTLSSLIHVKEALWVFIAFNFIYMYIKLRNAKRLFDTREFFEVNENLDLIIKYLIPLNLILALISVFIGVVIRGY